MNNQSKINDNVYDLFLGCVIPARFPYIEYSSRKVFEALKIELRDVEGYSCCPDPTGIELIDKISWLLLGARNLCLSKENKNGILSFCSGCVETLKSVNYYLNRDENLRKKINEYLIKTNKEYNKVVPVKHFAQLLFENLDKVKSRVLRPLVGFKVAVHYGCHYLSPSEIIQWDDPINPKTIDEIIKVLGAETVEYDLKLQCCGNPVEKSDKELSLKMIEKKLEAIIKSGANCIVVVCPACYQQYDLKQRDLSKIKSKEFNIPVFYLSELVALAFGYKASELGLKFHSVKTDELLNNLGFNE